eukprot:838917-Amorphochlora_amoeboformis.AAC.1
MPKYPKRKRKRPEGVQMDSNLNIQDIFIFSRRCFVGVNMLKIFLGGALLVGAPELKEGEEENLVSSLEEVDCETIPTYIRIYTVSYTHLRAHETD